MKLALMQLNPRIGDIKQNGEDILAACHVASAHKVDLLITPELSLCGYPPKDLLLRRDFLQACEDNLHWLAKKTTVPLIVGTPWRGDGPRPFNASVLLENGHVRVVGRKRLLPNYNVFDEQRYFRTPDDHACDTFTLGGKTFLMSICEDAWGDYPKFDQPAYPINPIATCLGSKAVDIILNISASPFSATKPGRREHIFKELARTSQKPVFMCAQVGGNDQLLFDGQSLAINHHGEIIGRAKACEPDMLITDLSTWQSSTLEKEPYPMELLAKILTMGIKDYVNKVEASGVVIGLSGGIDSALCAVLATHALGPKRVRTVFLPSRFSRDSSLADAQALAHNLGIDFTIVPIEHQVDGFRQLLKGFTDGADTTKVDIFDQNLQSRTRGLIIMGISNLSQDLMLTTSNKSELAVGYSTIYGDMCGAFSPIGDLYKTTVQELAAYLQKETQIFPEGILTKPPSAELKPNQEDTDSLPPFAVLDNILFRYIEEDKAPDVIAHETGYTITLIHQVVSMIGHAEYKRRQTPFSLMVSDKVFGEARRLPIAKKF